MIHKKKIVVVMPAYNAAKTLKKTFDEVPQDIVDEIILVDDASADETAKVAKKLKIKTFVHPKNRGYGGNQKTCYAAALNARQISSSCCTRITNIPPSSFPPWLICWQARNMMWCWVPGFWADRL